MAIRIQRKRTKDFTQPLGTIYVGRPTKWGNPFRLTNGLIYINVPFHLSKTDKWVYYNVGDLDDVKHLYEIVLRSTPCVNKYLQYWSDHFSKLDVKSLKGASLSCWCALDKPCHVDVLLRLANE